jgi:hypothetical protein
MLKLKLKMPTDKIILISMADEMKIFEITGDAVEKQKISLLNM